eukprot:341846-Amphidinium_carterae.1
MERIPATSLFCGRRVLPEAQGCKCYLQEKHCVEELHHRCSVFSEVEAALADIVAELAASKPADPFAFIAQKASKLACGPWLSDRLRSSHR